MYYMYDFLFLFKWLYTSKLKVNRTMNENMQKSIGQRTKFHRFKNSSQGSSDIDSGKMKLVVAIGSLTTTTLAGQCASACTAEILQSNIVNQGTR